MGDAMGEVRPTIGASQTRVGSAAAQRCATVIALLAMAIVKVACVPPDSGESGEGDLHDSVGDSQHAVAADSPTNDLPFEDDLIPVLEAMSGECGGSCYDCMACYSTSLAKLADYCRSGELCDAFPELSFCTLFRETAACSAVLLASQNHLFSYLACASQDFCEKPTCLLDATCPQGYSCESTGEAFHCCNEDGCV